MSVSSPRSRPIVREGLTRRRLLGTAAAGAGLAVAASTFGAPAIAKERSIRVGSYGGYFEDSFKAHVYPEFTKATGIKVESVTQPNSADWLITMQNAAASGSVPTDLSLYGRDTLIKAARIGDLVAPLDMSKMPNADELDDYFLYEGDAGLVGVGAMSWFLSMVVNPDVVSKPKSWKEFWNPEIYEASLGISKEFNSNFLDVVAATYFDGPEVLSRKDGIRAVIEKVGELRQNVGLWWSAESQMEQAMKNQDVIGGVYYHDVAGLMAADGFPIASIFPKEGNPQNYGSWCLAPQSDKAAEAHEFLNFTCQPKIQALMSRKIGTAPLVPREATDLTDAEFAAVSGSPVIRPNFGAYLDHETFIKDTWEKMLAGA
jgi:putative spermidine/putrescine transport system substrate-binding protein